MLKQVFAEVSRAVEGKGSSGFSSRPSYQRNSPFESGYIMENNIRELNNSCYAPNANHSYRSSSDRNSNQEIGRQNQNEDEFGSF